MSISDEVSSICQAFVEGLKCILGEKLSGVYVYGSTAFPDTFHIADIDFHVILQSELTDDERSKLERLHESLAERFSPLGSELDGYYILLVDAHRKEPPRSQMWKRAIDEAWALHREHILAGRCAVLHGANPAEIYPPASWQEIERALYRELNYVKQHLHEYSDYCILNLCRLIYSFETKDVAVSKAKTVNWVYDKFPQWRQHIDLARKSYAGHATPEDRQFMHSEVGRFLEFSLARIKQASKQEAKKGR